MAHQNVTITNLRVAPRKARSNLGDEIDLFIGRREELAQLWGFADEGRRLITVTGPPGVGKSRLLREFARTGAHAPLTQHGGNDPAELWLVDLGQASDPSAVAQAVAEILGLPQDTESTDDALLRQIGAELAARGPLMMLFDNAERLDQALGRALSIWLRSTHARVNFLVASRRPLRVRGEQLLELGPLQRPQECARNPEELAAVEAVALFVRRVRQQRPDFEIDERNAGCLAAIARRLDGLPLALELAAARMNMMSAERLLSRLDDRLELLSHRWVDGPPHHRSLQETFTRSWEMLDEAARQALVGCSVFEGSFAVEAAEAVLQQGLPDGPGDPLEALQSLREHSMLSMCGGARMRVDRNLRLFARARAEEVGADLDALQEGHARYYARRARALYDAIEVPSGEDAIASLASERDNLRVVLERQGAQLLEAPSVGRAELALEALLGLGASSKHNGRLRCYQQLREQYFEAIAAQPVDPDRLCEAYMQQGMILQSMYNLPQALAAYQEAHGLAGQRPPRLACRLASLMAAGLQAMGRTDEAFGHVEQGLALAKEHDLEELMPRLLLTRGEVLHMRNDIEEMAQTLQSAVTRAAAQGDRQLEGRALVWLAMAYHKQMRAGDMLRALARAAAIFREIGDVLALAHTLREQAWRMVDESLHGEALESIAELEALAEGHQLGWAMGFVHFLRGAVQMDRAQYREAHEACEAAAVCFEREKINSLTAASWLMRAICYQLEGSLRPARQAWHKAHDHIEGLQSYWGRAQILCVGAGLAVEGGELEEAHVHMEHARALRTQGEEMLLDELIMIYEAMLELPEYLAASERGKRKEINRRTEAIMNRLRRVVNAQGEEPGATAYGERPSPIWRSFELRLALRSVMVRLPEGLQRRVEAEMQDPQGEALLVDLAGMAFRAPGQEGWVELSHRATPFRLFEVLVRRRLERPGEAIDVYELCEEVWPEEQIQVDAASNRIYVNLSTLRRAGLGDLLQNTSEGYLIDPQTPTRTVD